MNLGLALALSVFLGSNYKLHTHLISVSWLSYGVVFMTNICVLVKISKGVTEVAADFYRSREEEYVM